MKLRCQEILDSLPPDASFGVLYQVHPSWGERLFLGMQERHCPQVVVFGKNATAAQCETAVLSFARLQSDGFWHATLTVDEDGEYQCEAILD